MKSKITPDTQPPNDIPNTEAKITMPTRVAASDAVAVGMETVRADAPRGRPS